jgi:TRAP-type C4-dicarboxylate transport system permease small subunit
MAEKSAGTRLSAILWFVAATLAWASVAIRYVRRDELTWTWAAAGLFFLIMGFAALKRSRAADSTAPRGDAGTR